MELKWVEDFISLAETRSFSRSAELRHVTQSAFSRRIRSLEVWLGTVLLDRSTYPITLTADGRHFLETAEEVVRLLTLSRADFRSRSEASSLPHVTITALHSLCLSVLAGWLGRIREVVGPLGSRVLPENFNICIQALVEGGYDLLFTYHHPAISISLDPERHPFQVIGQDSLAAFAATGLLTPDARGRLPLLQYSRGSFLGRLATIAQAQPGAPETYPVHTNENSMAEALRTMALGGHGVAWLPASLVAREVAAGTLTAVSPAMPMEIRLYRSAERTRPFLDQVWNAAASVSQNYSHAE
ncbi:LysR family transcriptional regulator [Methylobacterium sp. NFXW15]|uniref:LysR family transcriptional regulator n=1 Tax=Methylobacterium sp. NFXW15 TaxID=2819512 RepID=UPI003CF174FD